MGAVSYVHDLEFCRFSFQKAQETHIVTLYTVGSNITSPRVKRDSYMHVSSLTPGTIGAKPKDDSRTGKPIFTPS